MAELTRNGTRPSLSPAVIHSRRPCLCVFEASFQRNERRSLLAPIPIYLKLPVSSPVNNPFETLQATIPQQVPQARSDSGCADSDDGTKVVKVVEMGTQYIFSLLKSM